MKTKKSKWIWIILGLIVLVIGGLSIANCINKRSSIEYSEFYSVVEVVAEDGGDKIATKNELGENAKYGAC